MRTILRWEYSHRIVDANWSDLWVARLIALELSRKGTDFRYAVSWYGSASWSMAAIVYMWLRLGIWRANDYIYITCLQRLNCLCIYINEVVFPHVHLFRAAVGNNLFSLIDNATFHHTRCSGLSRQRSYSKLCMASMFSRTKPHRKCLECNGEAICWSKLSSNKQKDIYPFRDRGIG